jgi:hypothetical protein
MTKIFIIIVMLLGYRPLARAWNAEGHMIVAQIAYNHLNQVAKARCDALIAVSLGSFNSVGTSSFVTSATWADNFKASLGTGGWHYIDLPINANLDGTSTNISVDSSNVVFAINLCITNLQNPGLSQSNQAMSLRYLIHFVGDIQQPLHCSTDVSAAHPAGDAGGNLFAITGGNWSNLHSLWDSGGSFLFDSLSAPLTTANQNTLNAKIALIEAAYPYNYDTNRTIPNPMTWAQEGMALAKTNCYVGITNRTTPTTSYTNTAVATTAQRMAQGGHLLADLLNTLFPPITLSAIARTNGNFSFSFNTVSNSIYKVQWKQQLSDTTWNDLTNITATNSSISFKEPFSQTQRFYRVSQ